MRQYVTRVSVIAAASAETAAMSSSLNARSSGRHVLFEVGDRRRARDREHDRRACEQPRQRNLLRRRVLARRDRVDGLVVGRDRPPGQERDAVLLAHLEDTLGTAIGRVVAILDRRDRCDGQRGPRGACDSRSTGRCGGACLRTRSSTSAPIESSKGTFGSGACNWYSSMVSTRSRRKLASHTRRSHSGRPSGGSNGAVSGSPGTTRLWSTMPGTKPPLVAISTSSGYGTSASAMISSLAPSP